MHGDRDCQRQPDPLQKAARLLRCRMRSTVRILFATVVILSLTACSRVELAYENADWFGAWRIAGSLDLNRSQRLWLRDELTAYRAFHRQQRLPELIVTLDDADALLRDPTADADAVNALLGRVEQILRRTATDLIPLTAAVLRDLDAAQRAALADTLQEGRTRYVDERLVDQTERAIERTEHWTGPLAADQLTAMAACVGELPAISDTWEAWRLDVEEALLALLEDAPGQDAVEAFLQRWWLDEEARPMALRDYRETSRRLWQHCSADLLVTLTAEQRDQALARLARYRAAVSALAARDTEPVAFPEPGR